MSNKNTSILEQLIERHLNGTSTKEEDEQLINYFESFRNESVFDGFLKNREQIKNKMFLNIVQQIDNQPTEVSEAVPSKEDRPVFYLKFIKYAAAIIVLFATSFYFFKSPIQLRSESDGFSKEINPVTNVPSKVTLVLGNGKTVVLGHGKKQISNGVQTNDEEIVYSGSQNGVIEYNYLKIPRGEQYSLKLADGTKVWLNSESQLKFPNHFVYGKPRIVELVYGEAYFDVSPSTAHKGSSFKVLSRGQLVEVLGTEFNVKAYQDEKRIVTTLVEGSVKLSNNSADFLYLKPNQQAIASLNGGDIVTKSVDIYNEVSWKDGVFSFDAMPLQDVMKAVERWYNLDVVFQNESLRFEKFSGVIRKKYNLNQILHVFTTSNVDVDYDPKTRTIYMK